MIWLKRYKYIHMTDLKKKYTVAKVFIFTIFGLCPFTKNLLSFSLYALIVFYLCPGRNPQAILGDLNLIDSLFDFIMITIRYLGGNDSENEQSS